MNTEVNTMNRKFYSIMLVLFLSTGTWSFAQNQSEGRGPVAAPPVGAHNEHGGVSQGQPNKPSESNKSAISAQKDVTARLRENPDLASKLQGMLPAGMSVDSAARGFKSVGQFIAAVHVSKNLDIPFDQLRGAIVTNHMSLGDAIHGLKPEITQEAAKLEAQKAEEQAKKESQKIS
jgi:hypothetical protein